MFHKVKILKSHSKKCCIKGTKQEAYCFESVNWRKCVIFFRCNDPDCKFLVSIGMGKIDEFIKKFLKKSVIKKP